MRITIFSLMLGLFFTTPIIAQHIKNDFVLKGIHLEVCKNDKGNCIVLEGTGKYEHMAYPRMKIFINDVLVADTDKLYGIVLKDGYSIKTTLKELPKSYDCLLVVTDMDYDRGDVFAYRNKATSIELTETTKFELEDVSLLKEGDQRFIRLDFKFAGDDYWAYPLFEVEIDGKVVAKRGLQTYGLTKVELIPTDLEALPEHFELKLTVGSHGSKDQVTLEYKE